MPFKMKKSKNKIYQKPKPRRRKDQKKIRAGTTTVSFASQNQSSNPHEAPASVDLGSTPTEDISEALVNQYGLTSKRPIIIGSFDFHFFLFVVHLG